ncbi:GNAT family N-acetyltransferase [soil metagenome]
MSTPAITVRPSTAADIGQISAIYGWNVLNVTGTFEFDPPSEAEMIRRRDDVLGNGLPWLVAEAQGKVVGYAYANQFRPRPAYRFCVEDSIYLSPEAIGKGIGRQLLGELIVRCEAAGIRQMVAVIGDSENLGSIALHRALGFQPAGILKSSGRKFDRWLDTVLMQRALGRGDLDTPDERTLPTHPLSPRS